MSRWQRLGRRLWGWGPALLLMGLIFWASSRDTPQLAKTYLFPHQDKVYHAIVYCVLGTLYLRALHQTCEQITWRQLAIAALLTSLYGASDEWHQSFVPARSAAVSDWVADSVGGMLLFAFHHPLIRLFAFEERLLGSSKRT